MGDPFHDLAERYNSSGEILRQVIRHELTGRGLAEHLPGAPACVADVGGGAGQQAIPLSRRGYRVTIIDPSPKMLAEARKRLARAAAGAARRGHRGAGTRDAGRGDVRRGALPRGADVSGGPAAHDPRPLRPGGVVSVLAKNATALAMRPALEGRYEDALSSLKVERDRGRLGVITRGDTVEDLYGAFREAGVEGLQWYGVRVFTDHLGDRMPGEDLPEVLDLEWEAGRREPYRSVARLIHLVGRKKPIQG